MRARAAFRSLKIISFLPDPFSSVNASDDNLYAPHFQRIMRARVRELMRSMPREAVKQNMKRIFRSATSNRRDYGV